MFSSGVRTLVAKYAIGQLVRLIKVYRAENAHLVGRIGPILDSRVFPSGDTVYLVEGLGYQTWDAKFVWYEYQLEPVEPPPITPEQILALKDLPDWEPPAPIIEHVAKEVEILERNT